MLELGMGLFLILILKKDWNQFPRIKILFPPCLPNKILWFLLEILVNG